MARGISDEDSKLKNGLYRPQDTITLKDRRDTDGNWVVGQ